MLFIVRKLQMLSSEIYTEQFRSLTSREQPSLTVAIIPAASKGNTGFGTLQYWFQLLDEARKGHVWIKAFVTDMCSVGLSAGNLLTTPSEEMLELGCSYVGLPMDDYMFFDVFCQPSSLRPGSNSPWVPLPVTWSGDITHLIRLLRNLLDRLSFIVMHCIQTGTLRGSKVACFGKLRELANTRAAKGMGLNEVQYTILYCTSIVVYCTILYHTINNSAVQCSTMQ